MRLDRGPSAPDLGGATRLHARGKYRVFAELARGGMSIVYLAYVALGAKRSSPVDLLVLKELRPELAAEPVLVAMFIEEGRLAARLKHPNVVRTLDFGSEDGRHYLAMEYLEGQSLQRVLSRTRPDATPLPLHFLGAILCGILEGLAHAHAATDDDGTPLGIVHRDMSPHNVLVGFDGSVKVLDFGIAKVAQSGIHTRTGILKGKVPYMSPEQAAGTHVDARSDLFAVGIMLWEAALGQRFWAGASGETEILHALWQGKRAPDLEEAVARAPAPLRPVLERSVAMDPSSRYASAQEMLGDLRAALVVCGATPFGPRDVARVMADRFGDDRVRLNLAIDEALANHRRTSGEYAVSDLVPPSSEPGRVASVSAPPAPPSAPPLEPVEAPRVDQKPAARDALVAEAERIGGEVSRLQEGEKAAALPHAVAAIARAVRTSGGFEQARALETLSDCMQVVDDLERWRTAAVNYLRTAGSDVAGRAQPGRAPVDSREPEVSADTVRPVALADSEAGPQLPAPWFEGPMSFKLGAAAVAGAALAMAVFPSFQRSPQKAALASAAASPPAVVAAPVPQPPDRVTTDVVHVIVRATPVHARIVIDQQNVFDNPCVTTLPKDGAAHTAHVEADGYQAEDHAFPANTDLAIIVSLQRKPSARATAQAHAAAPPTPPPSGGTDGTSPTVSAAVAPKGVESCKTE
ncbi:MAG TPA: serine/threonine-protein kinase [Polyangiaceae bacterium]|jgi:serine/threonine-protein kinase